MSFQVPGGIKEKLFIEMVLFLFEISNPKPLKEQTPDIPSQTIFLLGFQSIPTVIKKCSYFKPYFASVEVCHYQEFPACTVTESPINFAPLYMQEWSIYGSACQHLCWTTSHATRQSQQGLIRQLGSRHWQCHCGLIQSSRCSPAAAG